MFTDAEARSPFDRDATTRPDIARDKIACAGISWDGQMEGILPTVEPRIKAVILIIGVFKVQNARRKSTHQRRPADQSGDPLGLGASATAARTRALLEPRPPMRWRVLP